MSKKISKLRIGDLIRVSQTSWVCSSVKPNDIGMLTAGPIKLGDSVIDWFACLFGNGTTATLGPHEVVVIQHVSPVEP